MDCPRIAGGGWRKKFDAAGHRNRHSRGVRSPDEEVLRGAVDVEDGTSLVGFSAGRRKEHPGRVRYPEFRGDDGGALKWHFHFPL